MEVKIDIYRIYRKKTNKSYVGQTKTKVINHGKLRDHGYLKRFKDHISEALNNVKRKQCHKLNNAIRKYGVNEFEVELITQCSLEQGDEYEIKYIEHYNTYYKGYNLTTGGNGAKMNDNIKQKLSESTKQYFQDVKNREKQSILQWQRNDKRFVESIVNVDSAYFYQNANPLSYRLTLYYKDKIVDSKNIEGKFMTHYIIAHRILKIMTDLDLPPLSSDEILEDTLKCGHLYLMELDNDLFQKPQSKKIGTVQHPRSKSYEDKNFENRIKRIDGITIKRMDLSLRKRQSYIVIHLVINRDITLTFGGKHHSLDYYSEICLNFIKVLKQTQNLNPNIIYSEGAFMEEFIGDADASHPLYQILSCNI
jgi:hypothetical protein